MRFLLYWTLPLLLLNACVNVNVLVTFPPEKLENAAEQIELDIEKNTSALPTKTSGVFDGNAWCFRDGELLYAETVSSDQNVKIDSPSIVRAKERRAERYDAVDQYKTAGTVGENREGLLQILPENNLTREQLQQAQDLVNNENKDRLIIYQEIVRINNMPEEALKDVQKAFAKTQRKNARPGYFIQNDDGRWEEKK